MLIFGATANCIPWVYVPEILPLHVRAKGTAVGISANWIWNFFGEARKQLSSPTDYQLTTPLVVMITPTLLNNLKWKGYLIFMCLNLSFIPLVVSDDLLLAGGDRVLGPRISLMAWLTSTSAILRQATSRLRRLTGCSTKAT